MPRSAHRFHYKRLEDELQFTAKDARVDAADDVAWMVDRYTTGKGSSQGGDRR
jgi:hypothetical protein